MVAVGVVALIGGVAPRGGPAVGSVRVALVQGGGRRGLDALEVPALSVYEATLRPTERLSPGRYGLVVWPEDVVRLPGPLTGSPEARQLSELSRRLRTTLIAGVTIPVGTTQFDNELVAFGPSGTVVGHFEKVHRVPFGEYVPFRSLVAHVANLSDIPRNAIPGHGSGMMATPAGRLALLVSFEDFFTSRGRSGVEAGGRLLVLATNTASYRTAQVPSQELAASRIQAVSEGRALVQAATTGYSASVTPTGAVLRRSLLGAQAVLDVRARLYLGHTVYDDTGSGPSLALAALLGAGGLALAEVDRRRRRGSDRGPSSGPVRAARGALEPGSPRPE